MKPGLMSREWLDKSAPKLMPQKADSRYTETDERRDPRRKGQPTAGPRFQTRTAAPGLNSTRMPNVLFLTRRRPLGCALNKCNWRMACLY